MDEDLGPAVELIDQLKARPTPPGWELEKIVWRILKAAGYATSEACAPGRPDCGYDLEFSATLDGAPERVAVEVKGGPYVSGQTFYQVDRVRMREGFDRILLVTSGKFSQLARDRAFERRGGKVDLLEPDDLANWLRRHAIATTERGKRVVTLIRACMRELALRIAEEPGELQDVEWRDLERLLREVFEGLGFDTTLTASTKDGGFDLRLEADGETFLVEVKHWNQAVGAGVVNNFLKVSAREGAKAGLLLSSGGFTGTLFEGIVEVGPPMHLGRRDKIIGLCRIFYRLGTELLQPDAELPRLLLEDTMKVPLRTCSP
jgi:HJR/Mrr/RecB family endonuclease